MQIVLNQYTTIVIVAVLVLLAIIWIGNKAGWFGPKPPKIQLTGDGGQVATLANGNIDTAKYKGIAQAIRTNLYGTNLYGTGMADSRNLLEPLNQNELRLVANEYAALYAGQDLPTIRELVAGETVACFGLYTTQACLDKDYILNRLTEIQA